MPIIFRYFQDLDDGSEIPLKFVNTKNAFSVIIKTGSLYHFLPKYFILEENDQVYETKKSIHCNNEYCDYLDDGCWCDLIKTLKTKHEAEANFMIHNKNLFALRKYYRMKIIAKRENLDQEEVKLTIDFWAGHTNNLKKTTISFIIDDKTTTLKCKKEFKKGEWSFKLGSKLPDEFILNEFVTYHTRSPLNCPLVKGSKINYIRCPKNKPCWCLLFDQIRSYGNGGIRIPLRYTNSDIDSSYYLEIIALLVDEDPELIIINASVEYIYSGFYEKKKSFYEKYILDYKEPIE